MKKEKDLDILFMDDSIVAINKPAGVLSIPDRYDITLPNLYNRLKEKFGEIYTVHRLDKGTSGVMIFARTPEAHKSINQQFQDKKVDKVYHAVVTGIVTQQEINIDIPLMPSPFKQGLTVPSSRGKESLTILKVIEKYRHATLVECRIVTGRHHQLRVHVAAIGHPLLIDDLYGNAGEFLVSSIKKRFNLKKNEVETPLISRITMHALKITLKHPESNETVSFEAAYPKDFKALVQTLSKYSRIN